MNKILGMDGAYTQAVEKRGKPMIISPTLVVDMVDRIRKLELDLGLVTIEAENTEGLLKSCEAAFEMGCSANCNTVEPIDNAKSLALYLESNIGSKYSCLRDCLEDFIRGME